MRRERKQHEKIVLGGFAFVGGSAMYSIGTNFQMVFANSSLPSLKTMFIEMLTFSPPKNDLYRLCIDGKEQGETFSGFLPGRSGQVKRISGLLWDKDVIYYLEIEESGEYPWGLFLKTTIRKLNWI